VYFFCEANAKKKGLELNVGVVVFGQGGHEGRKKQ
jgi:hypothetical protein